MGLRIKIVEFLNTPVPRDPKQRKISAWLPLLALIIGRLVNFLALYRFEKCYTDLFIVRCYLARMANRTFSTMKPLVGRCPSSLGRKWGKLLRA